MIGGGIGAFIGDVHRKAAALDGQIELVCGAFSSDATKSKESGKGLFLAPERCYGSWQEMIAAEAKLPADVRMDFVAIVTPNFMHFAPAKAALEAGFDVMSDKPATFNLAEAEELAAVVKKTGRLYGLTHTYTGYPMVKQMRQMIAAGAIGKVRKVIVEYPQGWLATSLEKSGQKQADWRTNPKLAGASCCMGDIGTHAENLAEYVTGLHVKELAADLNTFVDGRLLDDDGNVLLRFENGAKGILTASQIAAGDENNIAIRVYGESGGFEWHQIEPNTLKRQFLDRPTEIWRAGHGYNGDFAKANSRTPPGHPEGYLEAFANLYRNFAGQIRAKLEKRPATSAELDVPTIEEGVRGMAFVEAVVASSAKNAAWVKLG
jgi:predicted dehydrogenase